MDILWDFLRLLLLCSFASIVTVLLLLAFSRSFRQIVTHLLTTTIYLSWALAVLYCINPFDIPGPIDDGIIAIITVIWTSVAGCLKVGLKQLDHQNDKIKELNQ